MPATGAFRLIEAVFDQSRVARIAALAARQHGVVALSQLRASASLSRRCGVGRGVAAHPPPPGVYAVGHAALRAEGHHLAAVLACGPGAVLSHASAAALGGSGLQRPTTIDVTAPDQDGRRKDGLGVHRGEPRAARRAHRRATRAVHHRRAYAARPRRRSSAAARLDARDRDERASRAPRPPRDRHPVGPSSRASRDRSAAPCDRAFDPELLRVRSETEARFYCRVHRAGLPRPLVNRLVAAGRAHVRGRSPLARRPGDPRGRQPVPRHNGGADPRSRTATNCCDVTVGRRCADAKSGMARHRELRHLVATPAAADWRATPRATLVARRA